MRLTLRTLLAYLDDTLEPSEIKQIGQKVAESDAAQELIARLKQVTRRRRLTTPPDTGKGEPFDPNTVAAYLDNELPSEQVAELEKICLESDVHLAEIAACHQILTLVLGEPALVPPTAKERMYGLVKGREAIPFRKAPAHAPAAENDLDETDDAMMSVLAFHRQQSGWKRWALPVGGVLLFLALPVVLIVALMQGSSSPPRDTHPPVVVNTDKSNPDKDTPKDKDLDATKDRTKDGDSSKDKPEKDVGDPNKDKIAANKDNAAKDGEPVKDKAAKDGAGEGLKIEKPAEASKERREVAVYQGSAKQGSPSILVQRQHDDKTWKRLAPNTGLFSTDQIVSLPGYTSEIFTTSGVRLHLWGMMPQLTQQHQFLFESAVTLNANPKFDLDLTLERGRIYLVNAKDKGPARVRVRFDKEVWDVTLTEPECEVAIDFYKKYTPNIAWMREEPLALARLFLVQGKGSLHVDYQEFPTLDAAGASLVAWDNRGPGIDGPVPFEEGAKLFSKSAPVPKEANEVRESLDSVSKRMGEKKAVNVALREILEDGPLPQRLLSINCLGAIDAIPNLLDVLENKDEARGRDRVEAIQVLFRWAARGSEYARQLFDYTTRKSGILLERKYTGGEAGIVQNLLHYLGEFEVKDPDTYNLLADYLTSNKMAIRELAYWQLLLLSRGVKTIPPYNAAWDQERRNQASEKWKELVKRGELPIPPPPAPVPPGGAPPK